MSSPSKITMSITRLCTRYCTSRFYSSNTKIIEQQIYTTRSSGYRSFGNTHRRNFSFYSRIQSDPSSPSQSPSSSLRWILGTMLAIIFPFSSNKLGPLLEFKSDVDTVVETIEEVVDVVEKVAEVVDKVAENVSEGLPVAGKLKKVVDAVEDVAEKTAKNAQTVASAIDQEVEKNVENIVEALSDKANEQPKVAKG